MREAARALDDVSDHLGEVLRRADELLAEWSRFGAQVRTQVDGEVAAIGEVVDGAVARAASTGLDRAIADRLRALTAEIDRLEQRTRAASRAVVEHREADRRVLWVVVAGIVVANVLLVALLLRKPEPAPVAEPIRMESTAPQPPVGDPVPAAVPAAGSADPAGAVNAGSAAGAGAVSPGTTIGANSPAAGSNAASNAPGTTVGAKPPAAGSNAASNAPGAKPGSPAAPNAAAKAAPPPGAAKPPSDAAAPAQPTAFPIALPPRAGNLRPHKKLP
jgi:hypothetical protein